MRNTKLEDDLNRAENRVEQLEGKVFRLQETLRLVTALSQVVSAENQKLREANRWIPVSERLPAQNAYYYCEVIDYTSVSRWYGSLYVMQQWWNGTDWNTPESAKVIAWRELPEPYQEAGK